MLLKPKKAKASGFVLAIAMLVVGRHGAASDLEAVEDDPGGSLSGGGETTSWRDPELPPASNWRAPPKPGFPDPWGNSALEELRRILEEEAAQDQQAGQGQDDAKWIYIPATPNVRRGDVIVTKKKDGVLSPIMAALGNFWDHSLVALDEDGNMRHNTFDEKAIASSGLVNNTDTYDFINCDMVALSHEVKVDLPTMLNPTVLRAGLPGIENTTRFEGENRARLTIADEADRYLVENVASEMEKLHGYYILNSYVDMQRYVPTADTEIDEMNGGQCSSTIWWASKNAGMEMNNPIVEDTEILRVAAENMYAQVTELLSSEISRKVDEKVDSKSKPGIIDSGMWRRMKNCAKRWAKDRIFNKYRTHEKISNQLINAFLFNTPEDTSDYWRTHYQEVYIDSFSPAHILMAGMEDPQGNFNGMQTSETTYYDAITDYTSSGGYYVKLEGGELAPSTDPRLDDVKGDVVVTSADRRLHPVTRTYGGQFEMIPMPEEFGGRLSQKIAFEIKNQSLSRDLVLTGSPTVQVVGDAAIRVAEQPARTTLKPTESESFVLEFGFDPERPGTYAAQVVIPNDSTDEGDYRFDITMQGVNNAHFLGHPVYYNSFDDANAMAQPLIGDAFGMSFSFSQNGGYLGWIHTPQEFGNGYMAYTYGKDKNNHALANIDLFTQSAPDLRSGTIAFWASSNGGWRGKGDDTFTNGRARFHLTDSIYVENSTGAKSDYSVITAYFENAKIGESYIVPRNTIVPIVVQWDGAGATSEDGGPYIDFYAGGRRIASEHLQDQLAEIARGGFRFQLYAWTSNGGDHRINSPAYGAIDNVIVYDYLENPHDLMALGTTDVVHP